MISVAVLWRAVTSQCTAVWSFAFRITGLLLPQLGDSIGKLASDCKATDHISSPPNPINHTPPTLLMVGNASETWRIGDVVRKVYRTDPDIDITKSNVEAAKNEAKVYLILQHHHRIAKCLAIGPANEYVDLKFYPRGTLRDYIHSNQSKIPDLQLRTWACQLVESVAYIHSKGVRHADLRLDQWLLDEELHLHLADFNGSGFDSQPHLGLAHTPATSIESASYCLPRDFDEDSSVRSDLFALGSSIYELVTGSPPYEGEEDDDIESNFARHIFPSVEHRLLGTIIMDCWQGQYTSAEQILDHL